MAEISKKIRQSKVLCGENKIPYARAVVLMSLFTFLGAEFLFVNIIARTASGNLSVNAQNYVLGSYGGALTLFIIVGKKKKAVLPK